MDKLSISSEQAQHILDLTTRGSASHSAWLMFMYPRLQLAKDLLSNDGLIFISIDDNEQANLKLICDDIYGEENYQGMYIINASPSAIDYGHMAKMHEYALMYSKMHWTVLQVSYLTKIKNLNIRMIWVVLIYIHSTMEILRLILKQDQICIIRFM